MGWMALKLRECLFVIRLLLYNQELNALIIIDAKTSTTIYYVIVILLISIFTYKTNLVKLSYTVQ